MTLPVILICCDDPGRGGCAKVARAVWRQGLAGFKIVLATDLFSQWAGFELDERQELVGSGHLVHFSADERRFAQSTYDMRSAVGLIENIDPVLVVTHDARALTSMLALKRVAIKRDIPVVSVQHLIPRDYAYDERVDNASKVERMGEAILDCLQKTICVSYDNADRFLNRHDQLDEDKLEIINNGVPVPQDNLTLVSDRALPYQRKGELNCLMLGRITAHKRQELGVRLLAELHKRGMTTINLLLMGPEDACYAKQLRAQISELDLNGNVYFLGHHPNPSSVFKFVDVFFQFGLNEGLPLALLEAMAAKTCVLATNSGDVKLAMTIQQQDQDDGYAGNVLSDTMIGALVSEKNEVNEFNVLVENAIDLLQSPEKRKRYSRLAFEQWLRRFQLPAMLEKHENVMRRVISNFKVDAGYKAKKESLEENFPFNANLANCFETMSLDYSIPEHAWLSLENGWADQEDWGVMSIGRRSTLQLPQCPDLQGCSLIKITMSGRLPSRRAGRTFDIYIDNERIGKWKFFRQGRGEFEALLPAMDWTKSHTLTIVSRRSGVGLKAMPKRYGEELGLGLSRVSLKKLS